MTQMMSEVALMQSSVAHNFRFRITRKEKAQKHHEEHVHSQTEYPNYLQPLSYDPMIATTNPLLSLGEKCACTARPH